MFLLGHGDPELLLDIRDQGLLSGGYFMYFHLIVVNLVVTERLTCYVSRGT